MNDQRVLFIGGNLICGTMLNRQLLSGITVTDALLGCSPFALSSTKRHLTRVRYSGDTARCVDLGNSLKAYLDKHPADYLVVDLHYTCQPLVTRNGSYYTKYANMEINAYGKEAFAVQPDELSSLKRRQLINQFADLLLKCFPGKKIILIKTYKSAYFAVGNRIREQVCDAFNQSMQECENWFINRTGCAVVDTLRFYFMEKIPGGMRYENEAYLDTADNIKRYISGKHIRKRPIFRYSMDRYCRFYSNLYKKAFGAFLRTDNAVENLVYSAEPWFVQQHYALLRTAEKLLKPGYREVAEHLDPEAASAPLIRDILLAMDAVIGKRYTDSTIRYACLFENRIVIRTLWQAVKKYADEHWSDIFPEQITEVNYGYYFARMQLELSDDATIRAEAERIMTMLERDERVPLKPYVLDIWGSCVSRLNFQYNLVARRSTMVFRGNLFQALPIFLEGNIRYPERWFTPSASADTLTVKYQLDGTVRDVLNQTGTDWLVLDFYTLTALSVYRCGEKYYCDNNNFCAKRLGAEKVNLHNTFTDEEIFSELDKLADYVHERYGKKVILIKHKRMEHYIDFTGKLRSFSDKTRAESAERNPHSDAYADYFAQRSGCYYIDIIDQFISDEMNLLYLNSVHYENAFYAEVERLILHILEHQPKTRHFTECSSVTRIRRLAKLNANNPEHPVVQALFADHPLDAELLTLPAQTVLAHAEELAQLRDMGYTSLEAAVSSLPNEVKEALAARNQ